MAYDIRKCPHAHRNGWPHEFDVNGECSCGVQIVMRKREAFQKRVLEWTLTCFGEKIAYDKVERNHRLLEETLELIQSLGCTVGEAHQIVDYVFGRPAGNPFQELGGVFVTLAALCNANQLNMKHAREEELTRDWNSLDKIREKQQSKPRPLPSYTRCPKHGDQPPERGET